MTHRFLSPKLVPVNARNAPGAPGGRPFHPIRIADLPAAPGWGLNRCERAVPAHFLQIGVRAPSRSGTPANPLIFRPVRRKRAAESRARVQGLLSFNAGFCVAIGRSLRTSAVAKSEAVQGFARSAGAPRPAVPAVFAKRWNGLSSLGRRAKRLFFLPICLNRILNGRAISKDIFLVVTSGYGIAGFSPLVTPDRAACPGTRLARRLAGVTAMEFSDVAATGRGLRMPGAAARSRGW